MTPEAISIVKRSGVTGLAKRIAEDGDARGLDEHAFVDLVTSHALCEHRGQLSGAQAFARSYTASTPEGEILRKAHDVIKRGQFEPEDDDSDRDEAIRELQKIGDQKFPSLRPARRFARAMEINIPLAKRALRRPVPTTSFPFPR